MTPQQAQSLKDAQRMADLVTRAYGVPAVRVYAVDGPWMPFAAVYSYHQDWIFIRPEMLSGERMLVALSHELGHATLGHRPVELPPSKQRAAIAEKERTANRRGVEILVRFFDLSVRQALEHYVTVFSEMGVSAVCDVLGDLWVTYGTGAPSCEELTRPVITECPYDDWMSTGCKAGEALPQPPA